MNVRQRKKRRKKNDAIIREIMRMTLMRMKPEDWCAPLSEYDVLDELWGTDATETQD